jgi:preprotein translocase subunit Sec61beta
MPEWWTYRLSDLLLFSPRTYYRMFELYHAQIWPIHLVVIGLAVAIVVLLRRDDKWRGRAIAALLAASWVWVAIAFHLQRYATINWAAKYFAVFFVIEALMLTWLGLVHRRLRFALSREPAPYIAVGLLLVALVLEPIAGRIAGRTWQQVEVAGLTPDPTAVVTLALLALAVPRAPRVLFVIPVLWCVIGGATLWALGSGEAWIVLLSGLCGLLLTIGTRRSAA